MGDRGALFLQGFNSGAAIAARKRSDAMARDRDMYEREKDKIEWEAGKKEREARAAQIEFENEARKRDAADYVEAERAFQLWNDGLRQIDWGSPEASAQVEQLTTQYLPTITKSGPVLKKWQTVDTAIQDTRAFVNKKRLEQQLAGLQQHALDQNLGPEAIGLQTKVASGEMTMDEAIGKLRSMIDENSKLTHQRKLELVTAGRSRSQQAPKMGNAAKAELDLVKREIESVDEEITKLTASGRPVNDPKLLQLRARRNARIEELRSFDKKFAADEIATDQESGTDDGGESIEIDGYKISFK